MPLLSIVIPAYDVEQYIDACLSSVLDDGAFADSEVIVVDDGSSDGTVELVEARARRDARLTLIRQPNGGVSVARNTGAAAATGRYLVFLDSDDVIPPGGHAALVDSLEASGSDVAVGAYVRLRGTQAGEVQPWVRGLHSNPQQRATLDERPDVLANVIAPTKLYRRTFWDENGYAFPVGVLYEDQEMSARVYATARTFDVISDVVYEWRIREEQTSITQQEHSLVTLEGCLVAMRSAIDALERLGHPLAAQVRLGQILDNDLPRLTLLALDADADYRATLSSATRAFGSRATTAWERVRPVQRERHRFVVDHDWAGLARYEDALTEKPAQSGSWPPVA